MAGHGGHIDLPALPRDVDMAYNAIGPGRTEAGVGRFRPGGGRQAVSPGPRFTILIEHAR